MPRTVTVGLDGSLESRAAAGWTVREAKLIGAPVKLVHVGEPVPEPMAQVPPLGARTHRHWTKRVPRKATEGLRCTRPAAPR